MCSFKVRLRNNLRVRGLLKFWFLRSELTFVKDILYSLQWHLLHLQFITKMPRCRWSIDLTTIQSCSNFHRKLDFKHKSGIKTSQNINQIHWPPFLWLYQVEWRRYRADYRIDRDLHHNRRGRSLVSCHQCRCFSSRCTRHSLCKLRSPSTLVRRNYRMFKL